MDGTTSPTEENGKEVRKGGVENEQYKNGRDTTYAGYLTKGER